MSAKLKIKRGTTSAWNSTDSSIDKTLEPGQLGVEYLTDGNMRLKVGKQTADGSATAWTDLPYVAPSVSIYQDSMIRFKKTSSAGEDLYIIDNTLSSHMQISQRTSTNIRSTISLSVSSSINNISGEVYLSSRVDSGVPSFYGGQFTLLGDSDSPWIEGHITDIYTDTITNINGSGAYYDIRVFNNLIPATNSTSTTTGYTLGNSSYKWSYLYAYSGVIQTSDRSAKDSIHYIESDNSGVMKPATMSLKSTSVEDTSTNANSSQITIEDVIDFVSNLSPVTFCYKDGQGEDVEATEENSEPEAIQLGLIADDIKDHKLFKYVGVETTCEEEVTPAVKDEEGNVVTEAVTETKTTLGLQAIPLATAALTACKYLIQKNEEIELRLAIIEGQLSELLNQ